MLSCGVRTSVAQTTEACQLNKSNIHVHVHMGIQVMHACDARVDRSARGAHLRLLGGHGGLDGREALGDGSGGHD